MSSLVVYYGVRITRSGPFFFIRGITWRGRQVFLWTEVEEQAPPFTLQVSPQHVYACGEAAERPRGLVVRSHAPKVRQGANLLPPLSTALPGQHILHH